MKFAIVSTHSAHRAGFKIDPFHGDSTSFLTWVDILRGFHFSYEGFREHGGVEELKKFDLVMMSGHPNYMNDIIQIAKMLKDSNAVSMFYPEGSAQLYDNSIRGFHREYYEAWNGCDILSIAEEDKAAYYKRFVTKETLVRFVHVPVTRDMEAGAFFVPRHKKGRSVVVYGDNNPNHPAIAMACAAGTGAEGVLAVEIDRGPAEEIAKIVGGIRVQSVGKMSHYNFMAALGKTMVHFYPTEWIGTARQQIACAAVGTPCIGNHDSHTQNRLFPELGRDIYDIDGMCEVANRLIADEGFYSDMVNRAFHRMHHYGLEACKRRMMQAWADGVQLKGSRVAA